MRDLAIRWQKSTVGGGGIEDCEPGLSTTGLGSEIYGVGSITVLFTHGRRGSAPASESDSSTTCARQSRSG